jgi:hypothetical protein
MRLGLRACDKCGNGKRREAFAGRCRQRNCRRGRRRQCRYQHEAAGAATVDASIAAVGLAWPAVRGGCGIAGEIGVADYAAGLRRGGGRHLGAAEIREQAGECYRIGCRQRDDASVQQPFAEETVHRPTPALWPLMENTLAVKKFHG